MRTLFFIAAVMFVSNSAISQDFESPVHRESMASIQPHEWSTIDGDEDVVIMKGPNSEITEYVHEFLNWCGVEYGEKKYYVVNPNGQAWEISVVYGNENTWIIVKR